MTADTLLHDGDGDSDTYHLAWGRIFVRPLADETDILLEFDASLEARREALAFAKTLIARLEQPAVLARFVTAGDHYHVLFRNFGSVELRAVHSFAELVTPTVEQSSCSCCPCCLRTGHRRPKR